MFDLSIFLTAEAWISLLTLIFLELVLGIDNLVFITITTDRLPPEKRHLGRRLGLLGALLMRILFLCFASFLVGITGSLFTIDLGPIHFAPSARDLILLIGGAYLIFKGISELREMMRPDEPASDGDVSKHTSASHASAGDTSASHASADHASADNPKASRQIGLPAAVGTIMVMDLVFSIDSVITAVGLAQHLIIMIIAVMLAVFLMILFIDPISNFIGRNPGMRILALAFIAAIGVLLVLDGLGIHSGIEVLDMHMEKLMVYFAMVVGIILELLKIRYARRNERVLNP